jgi:hypothetical protein
VNQPEGITSGRQARFLVLCPGAASICRSTDRQTFISLHGPANNRNSLRTESSSRGAFQIAQWKSDAGGAIRFPPDPNIASMSSAIT